MEHHLVPKHSKLNEAAKEKVLKEYNVSAFQLPRILKDDPAIVSFQAKSGDVIKIERKSQTSDETSYYRVVVDE